VDYDSTDTDTDSNILTALGRNLRAARLACRWLRGHAQIWRGVPELVG